MRRGEITAKDRRGLTKGKNDKKKDKASLGYARFLTSPTSTQLGFPLTFQYEKLRQPRLLAKRTTKNRKKESSSRESPSIMDTRQTMTARLPSTDTITLKS